MRHFIVPTLIFCLYPNGYLLQYFGCSLVPNVTHNVNWKHTPVHFIFSLTWNWNTPVSYFGLSLIKHMGIFYDIAKADLCHMNHTHVLYSALKSTTVIMRHSSNCPMERKLDQICFFLLWALSWICLGRKKKNNSPEYVVADFP